MRKGIKKQIVTNLVQFTDKNIDTKLDKFEIILDDQHSIYLEENKQLRYYFKIEFPKKNLKFNPKKINNSIKVNMILDKEVFSYKIERICLTKNSKFFFSFQDLKFKI